MRKNKEYLLRLNAAPTFVPKDGDIVTIFDWTQGDSFTVISITTTQSALAPSVHVRATSDNAYGANNLAGSRIRYKDTNGNMESQEIVGITEL